MAEADENTLSWRDLVDVARHLHAQALSKAAILQYDKESKGRLLPTETEDVLKATAAFKRSHRSLGREGALADAANLKKLISQLDNAAK